MHRSAFLGVTCGLLTLLSSPTIALGQCGEASQFTYWEYDPADGAVVPLPTDSGLLRVDLCFDALDPESQQLLEANGGGYVNVLFRTGPGMPWQWVVQNAFESVPDQTWFELGNIAYDFGLWGWDEGLVIEVGEFGVTVLENPTDEMPGVTQFMVLPIEFQDRILPPGPQLDDIPENASYLGSNPLWIQLGFWMGLGILPVEHAEIRVPPRSVPEFYNPPESNIPAAHARSVGYLQQIYGFNMGMSASNLYQDYLNEMRGDSGNIGMEGGLEGRRAVNEEHNLPIRTGDGDFYTGLDPMLPYEERFKGRCDEMIARLQHGHAVGLTLVRCVPESELHPMGMSFERYMVTSIDRFDPEGEPSKSVYRFKVITGFEPHGGPGRGNTVLQFHCDEKGKLCNPDGTEMAQEDGCGGEIWYFHWDEFIPRLCDMNNDGVVNGADLAHFCGKWGTTPDGSEADGDFNGDGHINGLDLAILLGVWDWRFFVFGL
jgi:hypothetical protein